jgi:hypothetical protein
MATSSINPYLNRDMVCRTWLIFILIIMIDAFIILRRHERSQEDPMISLRRRNEVRDKT